MQHYAAFHLGLLYLQNSLFWGFPNTKVHLENLTFFSQKDFVFFKDLVIIVPRYQEIGIYCKFKNFREDFIFAKAPKDIFATFKIRD